MSEKIVDVTGTYTSFGISGGYNGYTLQIDDQEIPDMVRAALGIEYQDIFKPIDVTTSGDGCWGGAGIKSRWRLRVQIEVVEVDDG